MDKEKKMNTISTYRRHASDTGSPEVQIALLSGRINHLTEQEHKLITHGNAIPIDPDHGRATTVDCLRLVDPTGRLVAVGQRKGDIVRPEVVLV